MRAMQYGGEGDDEGHVFGMPLQFACLSTGEMFVMRGMRGDG